jgi:hypothetical protein
MHGSMNIKFKKALLIIDLKTINRLNQSGSYTGYVLPVSGMGCDFLTQILLLVFYMTLTKDIDCAPK